MTKLQALIFDVDGTLADTEEAHRCAFNKSFEQAGLDWHWSVELYTKLLGVTGGKERIKYFIDISNPTIPKEVENIDQYIAKLHQEKTHYYKMLAHEGEIPLRPGVERLIRQAHEQGYKLAIATTTTAANVDALFAVTLGTEILAWFDAVVTGEDVTRKKPDPEVYQIALDRLGLTGRDCLAFEDSELGVAAAKAAGIETIVTQNNFTHHHDFSKAILVLDHLGEPSQSFQILKGNANGHHIVDMELLTKLHAKWSL